VKKNHTKLKILQVLPSLNTGGVERGTVELALYLKKKGHLPLVASAGGSLVATLEKHDIHHITLPLASKNPLRMLFNAFVLKRLIQKQKIDIIHARSRAPAWSALWASKLTGCPLVTTFHGTYNFKAALKWFYNSVMVRGDRVIAISPFIERHILKHYRSFVAPEKITVIDRGVNLEIFSRATLTPARLDKMRMLCQVTPQDTVLLMPARLTRWKGQETVLQALSLLPSIVCVFVGPHQGRRAYQEELKALSHTLNLDKQVRFQNGLDDMPAAYGISQLCLHASTDPEGFGRVIIEAQAMGVPVIASRLGAPIDTIIDGVTGWLHDPGNAQDLAAKICHVLSLSDKESKKITDKAYERVTQLYSSENMCAKTVALYQNLVSKHDQT
jgi:glycosyltransferase involved in cell wall biosynthesis